MRRRLVFLLLLLCMCLSSVHATAEPERITLEVALTAGRDPNVNVIQDYGEVLWTDVLVREFQKEYPHVDVVFRIANIEQVIVWMIGGKGPDIINGYGPHFVNMGRQGMFVDLRPLLEEDGSLDEIERSFWPPQFEAFKHQGTIFALPQYLNIFAMYYNADMFNYMGIMPPEPRAELNTMDWDEFERIAKKLTQDQDGDGTPDIWGFYKRLTFYERIHYWLKAAGSDFFGNEEKTISTLNNPQAVYALEYLQRMRWESRIIPPPGVSADWLNAEVAIREDGSHILVDLLGLKKDGSPKVPFKWNVFPLPIGPSGERYTLAADDGYGINKNTKHLEEAYALLKFFAGPVGNEIKAKYLALQPAHRDVAPEYLNLIRELNTQIYDIDAFVFTDAGAYAIPEPLYADAESGRQILTDAYVKIFEENKPVGPTWSDAIDRLNRSLAFVSEGPVIKSIIWEGQNWVTRDFNTVIEGDTKIEADGKLVMEASGHDLWGYRDGFRFTYQEVKGDFEASVRLHSVPDTDEWSKAGIMLRTLENDAAPNVTVLGTNKYGLVFQERQAVGEATAQPKRISWTNGEPVYIKLIRAGNNVTGAMSYDGKFWTTVYTTYIDLPESVFIGPAVTSHAGGSTGKAVFSEWKLELY